MHRGLRRNESMSQARRRLEITRSASSTRSGEPFGLFVRPRGGLVRWQQCRGACEVVPLSRARCRLRLRSGSVGVLCDHTSQSCRRACEVLFSDYAPPRWTLACSVSRHHLYVAVIPTAPAITAPILQCEAVHECIGVKGFIVSMVRIQNVSVNQNIPSTFSVRRLQKSRVVSRRDEPGGSRPITQVVRLPLGVPL